MRKALTRCDSFLYLWMSVIYSEFIWYTHIGKRRSREKCSSALNHTAFRIRAFIIYRAFDNRAILLNRVRIFRDTARVTAIYFYAIGAMRPIGGMFYFLCIITLRLRNNTTRTWKFIDIYILRAFFLPTHLYLIIIYLPRIGNYKLMDIYTNSIDLYY